MIMCQNKDEPFLKGGVENTLHSNLDFKISKSIKGAS